MKLGSWLEITEEDGYSLDMLKSRLVIPNPEFVSRTQQGFSVAGIPRFDDLYETVYRDGVEVIRVPRGLVNRYGRGKETLEDSWNGQQTM